MSLPQEIIGEKKESVLLVDDTEINRILLIKMLSKYPYSVDFCVNGEEACHKILTKEFDVVLMDIYMPIMGGVEATKKIRAFEDPYFKHIPIIALTAATISNDLEQLYKDGFSDCQSKPFKVEELVEKISRLTSKSVENL